MKYLFKGFVFDEDRHELRRGGDRVPLRYQTEKLLMKLLGASGSVVRRDDLKELWHGDKSDEKSVENRLYTTVRDLRKALGDPGRKLIQTVNKEGYKLDASVEIEHSSSGLVTRPPSKNSSIGETGDQERADASWLRQVRGFVSFCHRDRDLAAVLRKQLNALERSGLARIWYEDAATADERAEQRRERESEIVHSDVFLAFASPDYLRCNDCAVELLLAAKHFGNDTNRIVPVLLKPCAWREESRPLQGCFPIPESGCALSNCSNVEDGCFQIVEQIAERCRKLAEKRQAVTTDRAIWHLCGSGLLNACGHRAVILARLRVLTEDPSLFCHRTNAASCLTVESTQEAFCRICCLQMGQLSELLGVRVTAIESPPCQ